MKVTLNWLKEFVDIEMPAHEVGELLTMAGLEVEGVAAAGDGLGDIVAARILSIEPHPDADRLSLCRVDAGGDPVPVVCGAPNLEKGMRVPLAPAGARLPDGTVLRESRIRGQVSKGMLLAEDEMGLTEDHSGIMALPWDLAPGTSLATVESLSDWVYDVDITPNRPDCASVVGIAREIAAATGKTLRRTDPAVKAAGPPVGDLSSVTIDDASGCPRYTAGVIQGVSPGASPFWLRYRLHLCGIRSINNIVDVTNYVMLESGQPLHAFDYDRLREHRIVVRRAKEGEVFTTLDGESRTLDNEILMICDGERPVAVAGIMGGLNSEIFAGTRNILVESAFFDPVTIRRGSKRLGLSTEASYRFERGADIGGVTVALKRALSLLSDLAGGETASGIIDTYPEVRPERTVRLRVDRTNRMLGTSLSPDDMSGYLRSLDMAVRETDRNTLEIRVPSYRVDLSREVDLVEEVARLYGYDRIPVTIPKVRPFDEGEPPELRLRDRLKALMTGFGFCEIISYSFISPDSADMLGASEESSLRAFVRIMNPLSVDQSVLRTSLVPGLLGAVRANLQNRERVLRLFEWGKVFISKEQDPLPAEKLVFSGIMAGPFRPKTWYADERPVDFYDMKGVTAALLKGLGLRDFGFRSGTASPAYDPEVSSEITCGETVIGKLGRVSGRAAAAWNLESEAVFLFELDIERLMAHFNGERKFRRFGRFPAVYRDISVIVRRDLESEALMEIVRRRGGALVESVMIFDVYQGEKMDPGEKAVAFRICYRSEKGTLDGREVNRLHESIIDEIREKLGGRLKEG